jgi:hypothetical protein
LFKLKKYFSYIVSVCFIGGGNRSTRRKPLTCHKSLTNFIPTCCIEYTSPLTVFEPTTLVVIGTDCKYSYKSNYHTITRRHLQVFCLTRLGLEPMIYCSRGEHANHNTTTAPSLFCKYRCVSNNVLNVLKCFMFSCR